MKTEQTHQKESNVQTCKACGGTFGHTAYIDHLFKSRDCMRMYWQEEEKTHVFRLRSERSREFSN